MSLKDGLAGRRSRRSSLTATPPYDTDAREWDNYEALCGPIDCEISVPELIKHRGSLSASGPRVLFRTHGGRNRLSSMRFAANLNGFARNLLHDQAVPGYVLEHLPWYGAPSQHEDLVFKLSGVLISRALFS